jgi:lipopolysaccharide/colanic/teichoic acid biosynthesis glycosyltransferase
MLKKCFDTLFSSIALLILLPLLLICLVVAAINTNSNGLFLQQRIGQFGKPFTILKWRTMHCRTNAITKTGAFFRKIKLDEFPQLINVVLGDMSIVGPRHDIAGYYDVLQGEERRILELKPGITSAASIKYRNEEALLAQQENLLHYNDTVIFPDKVKLNLDYYYTQSFTEDLKILVNTVVAVLKGVS